MVRVPLLFRGVAILLLIASTAVGQTPEPPTDLLSLDPLDSSPPDFLRQFSTDSRHPLLTLMVDGELASFEASSAQDSSKLKPTPKASSSASKSAAADDDCVLDGGVLDGGQLGSGCPTVSNCLPFACFPLQAPACNCRKCQRQRKHGHSNCGGHGCGAGYGYGGGWNNSYLNWPTCPAWCFYGAPLVPAQQGCGRHCGRRHHCGNQNCGYSYGCGYGGGWNTMGGDGFMNSGCGCFMPPPPQQCGCRKCQRHHRQHGCGNQGYGCGYGGGWGMGYGGYMDGGFCGSCMPYLPPPQQNCQRRCHRKHGCSSNYGYWGYGCPGWGGHPGWDGGSCGSSCGRHHGHFRGHRCHGQQPYPYCPYSTMTPCMGGEMFGMGGGMLGMGGGMLGTDGEMLGMDGGLGGDLTYASE